MRIAYVVDSSISLSNHDDFFSNEDCFFLPLHIMIDGTDYLDDNTLKREEIITQMVNAKKVWSSQPAIGEVELLLDKIISLGYDVVVTSFIGSGISGTQNTFYAAAIEKKLTIVSLDSKGVGPMNIVAIRMFKDLVAKGGSLVDIQSKVQHMLDVSDCYAIVDDLYHLKKGGRISMTSAIVGNLLRVKPIVMCSKELNGKVISIAKERTRKKAYETVLHDATKDLNMSEYRVVIGDFAADEYSKQMADYVKEKYPNVLVEIMDLCYAIGVHTGPKTIAMFLIRNI